MEAVVTTAAFYSHALRCYLSLHDWRFQATFCYNKELQNHRSIFWGSGGPVSSAVIREWCVPFRASLVRAGSREEERGRRVSGQRPVSALPLLGRSPGPGGRQQPGGWAGPGWREPVPEVGGCDATPLPLGGAPFLLLWAVSPQWPLSSSADDRGSWADREGLRVEGREPGPVAPEWPVLRPRGCEGPGGPWWACPFVGWPSRSAEPRALMDFSLPGGSRSMFSSGA